MSEGKAIVIAAIISVGGIVVTQFINYIYRKLDFKEKLFFEAYQKRLSIYEEAIQELQNMVELDAEKIREMKTVDFLNRILFNIHLIDTFIRRLSLFGSAASFSPLVIARNLLLDLHTKLTSEPVQVIIESKSVVEFVNIIRTMNKAFVSVISAETGRNLVDEKITKPLKKFTGKKRNKKQSGNCDIKERQR